MISSCLWLIAGHTYRWRHLRSWNLWAFHRITNSHVKKKKHTISLQCFVTWLIPSFHWSRFQHKSSSVGGLTGESENNQNRHDKALHDVRWHDMTLQDVTWQDITWRDVWLRENVMTGHDVTRHDMTGRDVTWREVTWHNRTRRFTLSDHRYTDHVARSCSGITALDSKCKFCQAIAPCQRRVAH